MKMGHVAGTKKETKNSQTWYAEIEAANIARIEAMAAQAAVAKLAEVVGNAITALPEAASRIAKAATLVQTKQVWGLTSGSYLVGSDREPTTAYLVTRKPSWHCDCADHTYRAITCKHVLAVQMTVKMGSTYHPDYTQAAA